MRLPIQYALTFPERPDYGGQRFDFARTPSLTFEEVDGDKFPALGIAYECLERGGTAPCTMNAANEVAVAAFLQGRIGYSDIVRLIERALDGRFSPLAHRGGLHGHATAKCAAWYRAML